MGILGIRALCAGNSSQPNASEEQQTSAPIPTESAEAVAAKPAAKIILPNRIPGAPEYTFTEKPITFEAPKGLQLPPGVAFEDITKPIYEKVNEEVLRLREGLANGKFQNPQRTIINFVVWLNGEINTIFEGDTRKALEKEKMSYFAEHGRKYHDTHEYRLNQYLLPDGHYLVTRPGPASAQLFDVDRQESQWVEAKMGGRNYRVPLLMAELGPEYKNDNPISGFARQGSALSTVTVVKSVLKAEPDAKRQKFEALLPTLDANQVDQERFYRELEGDTKAAAVRSVAQHEIGHYILSEDFPELMGPEQKSLHFSVVWQGKKLNRIQTMATPEGPNEAFTVGVQIATQRKPWLHHVSQLLNGYFKSPPGQLLALTTIIAAGEGEQKRGLIEKFENQGPEVVNDDEFMRALSQLLLSKSYTDEHSRKAGELFMQINYSYFLQNSERTID